MREKLINICKKTFDFLKKYKIGILLAISFLIVLIFVFLIAREYNIKTNNLTKLAIENKFDEMALMPKYEAPKEEKKEDEVKTPPIVIASINDKEDGQKQHRQKDNSSVHSIKEAKKQYEASGTSFGIDVSHHQGAINWAKVKQSGVEFAMIRVGYRGYGNGKVLVDSLFEQNIKGALANGIKVGVYFYSVAKNEIEALEEAKLTLEMIKGYNITYPVVFDLEDFNRHRLEGVSYTQLNKNAIAFLNKVKSAGYTPMIYGSKSTFGPIWSSNTLNKYKVWLAHYTDKTNYSGTYNMWQYTSSGKVNGISTRVDLNIAYFKYTTNESEKATSSNEVTKDPNKEAIDKVKFTEQKDTVITTTNLKLRKSPTTELDNVILTINSEVEVARIAISDKWSKVTYNGNVGYISNDYIKVKEDEVILDEPTEEEVEVKIEETPSEN